MNARINCAAIEDKTTAQIPSCGQQTALPLVDKTPSTLLN
jgi:hypothetical protein